MTGRDYLKFLIPAIFGILLPGVIGLSACYQPTPAPRETSAPAENNVLPPPEGKVPTVVKVSISGSAFSPDTVTVTNIGGAQVIWTNQDSVTHIVRSDDDLFDSGDLAQGETYTHFFNHNKQGTFQYHCRIHPSEKGKIIIGE